MKKIKNLILLFVLCLTCSFVNQERVAGSFVVDFKQSLIGITGEDTSEYTFNYGQKFVLAYGTVDEHVYDDPFYIVKTKNGGNYLTVNSKDDLPKLTKFTSNDWQLPVKPSSYVIFPISDYLLEGNEFYYMSDITSSFLGQSTSGECEQDIDDFIINHYNYGLYLTATDPSVVEDNKAPVMNNYHGMFITNVNNPVTVEEIKSHIKAVDDVDGDISSKIQIDKDDYTSNKTVIGLHDINFSVEDKSHNKAFLTVSVKVVDTDKPILTAPKELTSPLSKPLTIEEIKSQVSARDNYDKSLTITYEDNFTAHKTTVGDYNVIATVKDSSNNTSKATIVVHVKDDIKPVISGSNSYTTSIHKKITIEEIKAGLVVNDNVDNSLTNNKVNVVSDNYTNNFNKLGNYQVIFSISDKYNNVSESFTVNIKVEDKELPKFYVDQFIINCDPKTKLSNEQIIDYLAECNTIDFEGISDRDKQIVITYDGYQDAMDEGQYEMKLKISYDDGNIQDLDLIINKEVLNTVSMKWYTKAYRYMIHYSIIFNEYLEDLFTKVHNFFYNLFH